MLNSKVTVWGSMEGLWVRTEVLALDSWELTESRMSKEFER